MPTNKAQRVIRSRKTERGAASGAVVVSTHRKVLSDAVDQLAVRRCAAASMRSSVAVSATRTCSLPRGP
ncbi:Uncharacterised protein [Mycobacteroides abscessus subsp. abscessus]|nr:Uncharacterised protein [Mycobacteroides abscessus subsp. abscessus]